MQVAGEPPELKVPPPIVFPDNTYSARPVTAGKPLASRWVPAAIVCLLIVATFGALFGGPLLGDHETLVALIARNMRVSGNWLVPVFLDDPFVRKPPLPYWLVAAVSYVMPPDRLSGLPVSTAAARLPSALAAVGLVLILWKLASQMFGVVAGRVAAVAASTSILVLLFAPNATVEMLLTFCCTWAVAHFWFAVQTQSSSARAMHMALFYVALGLGMLAKGPAPMALVGVPLAVWWYTYRPQRILARRGARCIRRSIVCFVHGLWTQTIRAFTRLWVIPGIFLFAAVFVPWVLAVAKKDQSAWNLWDWQYLQRFEGNYEDTRYRGPLYYVPIALGFVAPWTPWLIVGLFAPWIASYRRIRKPLYFAGILGVVGVAVMSAMTFKKPYYIAPAISVLLLLLTPPLTRWVMARSPTRVSKWSGVAALLVALLLAGFVACWLPRRITMSRVALYLLGMNLAAFGAAVTWLIFCGRRSAGLALLGMGTTLTFLIGWYTIAPAQDNVRRVELLDRELAAKGIPREAPIYFADQRPDARLPFYYGRRAAFLLKPSEIVQRMVDRTRAQVILREMTLDRAAELLGSDRAAYLLVDREHLPSLKMLPDNIYARVKVLVSIDMDGLEDADDWVVVTNSMP